MLFAFLRGRNPVISLGIKNSMGVGMNTCPFCGALKSRVSGRFFECGTEWHLASGRHLPGRKCQERQRVSTEYRERPTLTLVLKQWPYMMIESKDKREEYRDLGAYWSRFFRVEDGLGLIKVSGKWRRAEDCNIRFAHGYSPDRRTMFYSVEGLRIGVGNEDWGAGDKECFCIKLGRRVDLAEWRRL